MMIIFVYGPEGYLATEKLIGLKKAFIKKYPGAQLKVFDFDDDVVLADVQAALESGASLFSAKRCLVLRNGSSLKSAAQEELVKLLKNAQKSNGELTVIIAQTSGMTKGKLFGYLKKNAQLFGYVRLDQKAAENWAAAEIKRRSKGLVKITSEALKNLCEIAQSNLWQLSGEIDKLIQYCSKGEIRLSDLEKISKGRMKTKIFDLVDAIGLKNKARAIELKNNLVMQGDNEFYIFSMIHLQFRNMFKVYECLKKGLTDGMEISKRCLLHPYVVKKTLSQKDKFGKTELKRIFLLASRIDRMTKSGEMKIGEALDYFIIKI